MNISEVLQLRPVPAKSKINNKRQYVLSLFLEAINSERGGKYKPINPSYLAFKLSHLSVPDLEYLYSVAMDYKHRHGSFSKCFWGILKVK